MTTATDWDVRDRETNDQLRVTDVQAALSLEGAATDVRFAELPADRPLTQDPARLTERIASLEAENDRLQRQLAALRAQADPLTAPWLPDVDPPTRWTEETLIAQWAAAHRDSYDVGGLMADSHRREREAVDSLLDYTEQVTAHEPADVWGDALRALTEPVAVDYSYRQSEAWALAELVVSQSRQHSVYAELAPERINEGESPKPITFAGESYGSANSTPDVAMIETSGQDDRIERMIDDPDRYFREARERAASEVDADDDCRAYIARQRQHRDTLAPLAAPTTQVAVQSPTYNATAAEPDGWVASTWWRRALARFSGRKRGL